MSRLRIFDDTAPQTVLRETRDHAAIARELDAIGVGFERWEAGQPVQAGDPPEAIMAAYRADIDRLVAEHGFRRGVVEDTQAAHASLLRSSSQPSRNSNASRWRRASAIVRPHAYRPWPSIR